jgi:glycerophosphoryl diester phosphodiesterase
MHAIFSELKKPYILAHQGGELLAPTNTMAAFAVADSIGVDFLDIDVHMTRDGHLVGIHDSTVDRTTNGHGRVDAYTLADLQKLDAGYNFKDLQGNFSYRGKGVRIPALEEVFSTYATKYYLHFEIKDAYPKNGPSQIEEKLWALIQKYQMEKKVIVASFQQAIVERFHRLAGEQVIIGAGKAEVARFVFAHKLRVPGLYRRSSHVLEIPLISNGISLKDRRLIDGAHRLGMHVYYWTIDDKATMKELIELGADGLFTNRPDLLKKLIYEMHLR